MSVERFICSYVCSCKRLTWDLKTQIDSEGIEKGISCKWQWKEAGVTILISDKIDLEQNGYETKKDII